jgi:hypothetical protein
MDKKNKRQLVRQQTNSFDLLKPLKKISKRFNLILFFVFVVGCSAGAILLINNTLKESTDSTVTTPTINSESIDQSTLDRLNSLHTSTQAPAAQPFPTGRVNPVGE